MTEVTDVAGTPCDPRTAGAGRSTIAAAGAAAPGDDGRSRRRTRNIDRVVDAMLGLLAGGELWPSAADIAARAGLSERSVFRYFADLDTLARAAVETQIRRADHLFTPLPRGGGRDERVNRLVEHRVRMFDEVGPIVRAARLRASLSEPVAEGLAHRHRQLRVQIEDLLAPELAGAGERPGPEAPGDSDLLVALDVATGLDALHTLRTDRGCSAERTRRILHRTVHALLASPAGPVPPVPSGPPGPT